MNILHVRISSIEDIKSRFTQISDYEKTPVPTLNFLNYSDMHKILSPARLAVIKTLAGNGDLSIREVARRLNRDVHAVHKDITMLEHAGVIDKTKQGISFPYDGLHFDFDISVAA